MKTWICFWSRTHDTFLFQNNERKTCVSFELCWKIRMTLEKKVVLDVRNKSGTSSKRIYYCFLIGCRFKKWRCCISCHVGMPGMIHQRVSLPKVVFFWRLNFAGLWFPSLVRRMSSSSKNQNFLTHKTTLPRSMPAILKLTFCVCVWNFSREVKLVPGRGTRYP